LGAIGCKSDFLFWNFESNAHLLHNLLSKRHVLFQLAVNVRDAVRDCCADPDAEAHAMLLDIVIPKQAAVVTMAELAGALPGRSL
jgi:hypothetical protein